MFLPRAVISSVSSLKARSDRSALPLCSIIVRTGPIFRISSAVLMLYLTDWTDVSRVVFAGCVAVRSDHLCGVWRFSESDKPRLLQVINTTEVATCISAR